MQSVIRLVGKLPAYNCSRVDTIYNIFYNGRILKIVYEFARLLGHAFNSYKKQQ